MPGWNFIITNSFNKWVRNIIRIMVYYARVLNYFLKKVFLIVILFLNKVFNSSTIFWLSWFIAFKKFFIWTMAFLVEIKDLTYKKCFTIVISTNNGFRLLIFFILYLCSHLQNFLGFLKALNEFVVRYLRYIFSGL